MDSERRSQVIRRRHRYVLVLSRPYAWRFFLPASFGRLGVAMTGLGLLWLVQSSTASFAVAGAVTGSFAVAEALVGPQSARLVDRFGQGRALPPILASHTLSMAAVVIATLSSAPTVVVCAAAVAAGASLPQLGAYSAARWARLVRDPSLLESAFALETTVNDLAFLGGPTLVVAIAAGWSPVVATCTATALVVTGGAVMAAQHHTDPVEEHAGTPEPRRRLFASPFLAVIVVNTGLGLFFGSMQLAVVASATAAHQPAWGGAIYSLLSVASLLGGLGYGARRWTSPPARLLLVLTLCFLALTSLLLVPAGLTWLAVSVTTTGLVVAPIMVTSASVTERTVPASAITQAFSWTNSASAAGIAVAAAITGVLIDRDGAPAGFTVTLTAAGTTVVGALLVSAASRAAPSTKKAR